MFKSIKSICRPGSRSNEDAFGVSDSFLFVMDGATMLGKSNLPDQIPDSGLPAETAASRFVGRVANNLMLNLGNLSKPIEEILFAAVTDFHQDNAESPDMYYRTPCASIAVFRGNGTMMEYYGLGDCTAAVSFRDSSIHALHDETLTSLDQKVIQEMSLLAKEKNIHVADARKLVEKSLIANRNKMNQENGYWVLDASGKGISHGEFRTFSSESIHSVSLMTDGFADICTTFPIAGSIAELHDRMYHEDLENLVKELFLLQDTDPHFDRFPRFKHRDDTTAIFALL